MDFIGLLELELWPIEQDGVDKGVVDGFGLERRCTSFVFDQKAMPIVVVQNGRLWKFSARNSTWNRYDSGLISHSVDCWVFVGTAVGTSFVSRRIGNQ